jgi:dephospho-CoA kinase
MRSSLTIIALTGGIATGKSTCCSVLRELLPELVVFDADQSVASLYQDSRVIEEIGDEFGDIVYDEKGGINKAWLRERAFGDLNVRRFLEQIFHPRVRQECLALLEREDKYSSSRLFVADIPLLFESGFDFGQSANLLVATSRETQIDRLKNRSGWDDDRVEAVLSSQMPIDAKFTLADIVFWNEGPEPMLRNQCHRFLQSITDL